MAIDVVLPRLNSYLNTIIKRYIRGEIIKFNGLLEDEIIKDWLSTINPKPNTRKSYRMVVQVFTDWTDP